MEQIEENKKFLNADELANRWQTKRLQIYEWEKNKTIPQDAVVRIGRKLLFDSEKIVAFEAQGGTMQKAA